MVSVTRFKVKAGYAASCLVRDLKPAKHREKALQPGA